MTDDAPSDRQESWQDIAFRLRLQIGICLTAAEREQSKDQEGVSMMPDLLEKLSGAAWSVFMLERQAANMDRMMQREGGWN